MMTLRPKTVRFPALSVVFAAALMSIAGCAEDEPYARAYEITRLDQTIGGPKALARPADPATDRPGDLILENDRIRVAILGSHPSMGPSVYGGSLADADIQWNDPRFSGGQGRDQLAEIFANANMNVLAPQDPEDVFIVSDGSDGGPATIRVISQAEPFLTLLNALWALVDQPEFHLITDYTLSPGESWVRMDSQVILGWDGEGEMPPTEVMIPIEPGFPLIETAVEDGIVGGDFYLQGGSVDVFAPGIGFDEDGFVFDARKQDRNLFLEPANFAFLAGVGDGISYGIAGAVGDVYVPLFTASQTATFYEYSDRRSGQRSLTYSRYFFVGTGDVGSILDGIVQARDIPHGAHLNVLREFGYDDFLTRLS
mgnify:CR=1 FL=1